jgi:hypothetical protein
VDVAILSVGIIAALAASYVALIEVGRRRDEVARKKRAEIRMHVESRSAGGRFQGDFLVIRNEGPAIARDLELVAVVAAVSGQDAIATILDRDIFPLATLRDGDELALHVVINFGEPVLPWSLTASWLDDSGTRIETMLVSRH